MKRTHLTSRLLTVSVTALALSLCLSTAVADDKTWDIKPGDTLGSIVAQEYPGYANRKAIMEAILKASPDAFINNDLNRMTVGKTLKLPAADSIPGLQPPPPPSSAGVTDQATQEKLQALQAERDELGETIKLMEDENAQLQELIQDYEETKKAKDAELAKLEARVKELEAGTAAGESKQQETAPAAASGDIAELQQKITTLEGENIELQTQLETAKMDLDDSQAQTEEIKTQLADLQRQNDALSNDLQQARAATAVAESNAAGSSYLPWILLGLMALLMLPLMWLLKRNRDEPRITTLPAPLQPAAPPPAVSARESTDTPLSRSTKDDEQIEEIAATEPANPDADLKLDIARAYLDLRNPEAAADILKDVMTEGGSQQKQEAREILSFIS
ncbi:MAG: hypothetical protein KJ914_03350 [Gammaproteobacteria bacterium]|nr:hypothetical protein [Gammaproteobacteria bacterium]MBU1725723.1 hypothetical protein [Gammaproteobacteria bacterium]MBU2003925.1 hypothetical protein [Gammaproteobacteria bacterium]